MPESLGTLLAYTGVSAETAGTIGTVAAAAAPTIGSAVATAGVTQLLAPKPPTVPGPIAQPDALAQEQARQRAIAESMARRGRASTILTAPASGTLGG